MKRSIRNAIDDFSFINFPERNYKKKLKIRNNNNIEEYKTKQIN